MTEEDFQQWKESNSWFFEYLENALIGAENQAQEIAKSVLVCPESELTDRRLVGSRIAGEASILEQIINLTYEDIEDSTNASNAP